jgi:hypothetical protein
MTDQELEIIRTAAYRIGAGAGEYREMTNTEIKSALQVPVAIQRLTGLTQLVALLAAAGADPADFAPLWMAGDYIQRVDDAVQTGDLGGMQALLAVMPGKSDMSAGTLAALDACYGANGSQLVTLLASVAAEFDQPVPQNVLAADIAAALGR